MAISLGMIVKPHGLKGVLKVSPFFELLGEHAIEPGDTFSIEGQNYLLELLEYQPQGFLVKFKGVDSVESAERLRGKKIMFPEIPPRYPQKGFYLEEIIGFEFTQKDSGQTGRVCDIYETGAHFNLTLENTAGQTFDVPMIPQFVENIDLKKKRLSLDLSRLDQP